MNILINGSLGRMGQALIKASEEKGHSVVAIDQGDDPAANLEGIDVAIDFSHHTATLPLAKLLGSKGIPLIIGTTGHSEEEKDAIRQALASVPVVWAGNYSLGVNLLFYLTQRASEILPNDYDVEVIEMHHRFKKDAPSGTAENLLERIKAADTRKDHEIVPGRSGITGERTDREIGVHALRGGDVVGDHTVMFATLGERVELTHKASDRMIFARGAVHAAQWAIGQDPAIYSMQDVLGLK